ncbi:GNAT family N-acetyltransferase [Chryseobacterium taklimakanense]|uniref:GNAT family N-acetyltransferase n=1 Tax=Chryseobacterium taklimakanense TaxID=536441 RepID=UPI0023F76A8A|nr:GNAT family N-acetyltransferase [Chryseobacterium taklimakanense]
MTEIKHHNNEKNGVFEIYEDGVKAGEMTYTWAETDKFIIDHTEVNEQYGGLGLGKKLVEAAVNFAREKGIKIVPLCSFAKKTIEKTQEFQDVLS